MAVNSAGAAARRHVGGSTVVFCSTGCAEAFDADPDRYRHRCTHDSG
jgi:Cu+-exporting ATPase